MMMIGQYRTTQADGPPGLCGRDINVHDRGLTLINKFGQIIEISKIVIGNILFLASQDAIELLD